MVGVLYGLESPMITKTILQVRSNLPGASRFLWIVHHDRGDGVLWDYAFPHDTLTYRSAEYGIDPNDADTLLDVVLHEFHMEPAQIGPDHPQFLYNTDERTARRAHLARVQELKNTVSYEDPQSLLDLIKRHHLSSFDSRRHTEHRSLVASLREQRMRALAATSAAQPAGSGHPSAR
jgi:hypothetical protein